MNISRLKNKRTLLYTTCFLLLFFSFYLNIFKIVLVDTYRIYETYVEALVVGKMAKMEKDGMFASAGFPGVVYDKAQITDSLVLANMDNVEDLYARDNIVTQFKLEQIKYYYGEEPTPDGYTVYVSHSGGNALFYYIVQKILPFDPPVKYQILRAINCSLMALCFMLFIGWTYRNFGFIPALITFLLTFFSSWPVLFGGNGLWWSLWNFFVPFLVMLLLLEKKHNNPDSISYTKICICLFVAFLVKLMFSGLEFISTAMLTPFIPIIYYSWLEKDKVMDFIKKSLKASIAVISAVIIQFLILILQLKVLLGSFNAAYSYIMTAFTRRASFQSGTNSYDHSSRFADSDSLSFLWNNVLKDYLRGDVFFGNYIHSSFQFFFAYLIGIIALAGAAIVVLNRRRSRSRKLDALVIATAISIACPMSWFIIFKEHSFWHPQIDYIIWYMPFLLLGFAVIGTAISVAGKAIRKEPLD